MKIVFITRKDIKMFRNQFALLMVEFLDETKKFLFYTKMFLRSCVCKLIGDSEENLPSDVELDAQCAADTLILVKSKEH